MMMDCASVKLQALVVCDGGDTGQRSDGTQKSKDVVHSQYGLGKMVRPAGFEPASAAWKAAILDQARLWSQSLKYLHQWLRFKIIDELNYRKQVSKSIAEVDLGRVSGRLGSYICLSLITPVRFRTGQWKAYIIRQFEPYHT